MMTVPLRHQVQVKEAEIVQLIGVLGRVQHYASAPTTNPELALAEIRELVDRTVGIDPLEEG